MAIYVKRVYEPASKDDGQRILVDRMWPRGLSKEQAHIDEWVKVLAPSNELRKWFHAHPSEYLEFCLRYRAELLSSDDAKTEIARFAKLARHQTVTLLFGSKSTETNNAVVLAGLIQEWTSNRTL